MKHVVFFLLISVSLFGDQFFVDRNGEIVRMAAANTAEEISIKQGKEILVRSFMTAYEDVPLAELNPSFQSIGDVRRFYEHYFECELEHFKKGSLIWVQAFVGEELVGWATFQLEKNQENAAYMNLLAVDPSYQKMGIGKQLVFSIFSEELFPNIQAINVLIRKVNLQGRQFYEKIGFFDFPEYQAEDNFVDNSLLVPIRWERQ